MKAWTSGLTREGAVLLGVCFLAGLGLLGLVVPPPADAHPDVAAQALDIVRVLTTTALAVVLVLGPGLILRARLAWPLELGFLPLPGLTLLLGTGCLAWGLGGVISPRVVCIVVLILALGCVLAGVLRGGPDDLLDAAERDAVLIVGAVLGVAVARSLWSLGPAGELSANTIFRTLEVGDRPDPGIPFGVVRLLTHGVSPFGALGRGLLPDFSIRGPLSGIASAPLVVLAGGRPPLLPAHSPWLPYDPQGYMGYRLAMMTFAGTAFLSVWTLTRRLAGERAARLAVLLAAAAPFLVHEVWFTWPKLLAASLMLLAAVLVIDRRPLLAGLMTGVAYLVHPLALFSLPVLVLLAVWSLVDIDLPRSRLQPVLLILGGAAIGVVAWRLVNGAHYAQGDFLSYVTRGGRKNFLAAQLLHALGSHPTGHARDLANMLAKELGGHQEVTVGQWLSNRGVSVGNTLVPLRLFLFAAHDPSINAINASCTPFCAGNSPPAVHFFFQYWTSLPFGVGIVFFPLLLTSLGRAARIWKRPILIAVAMPFGVFAIYWGDADTGLLREGLHTWVLTLFVVIAVEQKRQQFGWLRSAPVRALLALRSLELVLVAMLPTVITRHRFYEHHFLLSDIVAVVAMVMLSGCLGRLTWRERPDLQSQA